MSEAPAEAPAPYWKCVAAALPDLFLALQFLMVTVRGQPFLGALALWKTQTPGQARTRAVCFWGLFALYVLLAMKGGLMQLAAFLFLTVSTYLGLFLNWRSPSALVQLGVRWVVGFAIFILVVGVLRTPKDVDRWAGNADVMLAGVVFFALAGLVELSGFHLRFIPRHASRILAIVAKGK